MRRALCFILLAILAGTTCPAIRRRPGNGNYTEQRLTVGNLERSYIRKTTQEFSASEVIVQELAR